jgi:hypothetical protein
MDAILTNRLFHLSGDQKGLIEMINEATKGRNSEILKTRPSGDIEVDVPLWLDTQMF